MRSMTYEVLVLFAYLAAVVAIRGLADDTHLQQGPMSSQLSKLTHGVRYYWDAARAPLGTNHRCNELTNMWIQAGPDAASRTRTVLIASFYIAVFFFAITLVVKRALTAKGIVDKRILFHAARAPIWLLFLVASIFSGMVEGWFISNHLVPIEELHCFDPGFYYIGGFLIFLGLLVNDIVWFTFVFQNLHDKADLVLHHVVYLALGFCTIFGLVEYVPLFYGCCALEESGELISSMSYLCKDGSYSFFWFVLRSVWRLATYSFAIGITVLFLMFGHFSQLIHYFMITAALLWVYFLISDFIYFFRRVKPLDAETGGCCSCSKRNSQARALPMKSEHNICVDNGF